jgi:hypothetical protein
MVLVSQFHSDRVTLGNHFLRQRLATAHFVMQSNTASVVPGGVCLSLLDKRQLLAARGVQVWYLWSIDYSQP